MKRHIFAHDIASVKLCNGRVRLAEKEENVIFGSRLAGHKYHDMDDGGLQEEGGGERGGPKKKKKKKRGPGN